MCTHIPSNFSQLVYNHIDNNKPNGNNSKVTEAVVQERSERLLFWKISQKLLGTTYNITKIASFRWFL